MSRIFWDTNLFIYLFEAYGEHSKKVKRLRQSMLERSDQLVTSSFTLAEILVKPLEHHDHDLARKYELVVTGSSQILLFDIKAARLYARIRSDRSIRAPDAIQLACAAAGDVDLFITNDARLQDKRVDGIQFIVSLERAPL
jgi:predicted nucleic acid-binding protein